MVCLVTAGHAKEPIMWRTGKPILAVVLAAVVVCLMMGGCNDNLGGDWGSSYGANYIYYQNPEPPLSQAPPPCPENDDGWKTTPPWPYQDYWRIAHGL
jgi:hypothetical protein